MSKFDWTQYDLTTAEKNTSAYCALYWYAHDYNLGQNSWQYKILSNSPYTPSPNHNSILDGQDNAALDYYQYLISLFEDNYKTLGRVLITEYPNYRCDIVVNPVLIEESYSHIELSNEIYSEIIGECLDYYPSIVDVYEMLEGEFNWPYSPPPEYDDDEEYCSLSFCFDFIEDADRAEGDIFQ